MKEGEHWVEEGNHQIEVGEYQVEEDCHQVEDDHLVEDKEQVAVLSVLLACVCKKVDQVTAPDGSPCSSMLTATSTHVHVIVS